MQVTIVTVIDIIMLVSILFAVIRGWHIGLAMKLAHLITIIASCIIAHFLATVLKVSVGNKVVLPMLSQKAGDTFSSLPFAEDGMEFMAQGIAYYFLYAIVFIIAMIVLSQAIKVVKIVDHIPVIGLINKIGGAIIGFFIEFIVFYIICAFVFHLTPQATLDSWGFTREAIEKTYVLQAFVNF